MSECRSNPIGYSSVVAPGQLVEQQFDFFTEKVNEYLDNANGFSQVLESFQIPPVSIQSVSWDLNAGFTPFEAPEPVDEFEGPLPRFDEPAPDSPGPLSIDTSPLNVPGINLAPPTAPPVTIPVAPTVTLPAVPSNPPVVGDIDIPVYSGAPLPQVPTLYELNLPSVPDVNIDDLVVDKPTFNPPDTLQDVYRADLLDFSDIIYTGVDSQVTATGVKDMHSRLQAMLAGGTGLPVTIEQALFDRAIGREDVSSLQAVAQAEQEWAARGFTLPGSTLLARVQEIRQSNRNERGRINRELSIQFHQQEIENLRFAVQQAIGLEGTLLQAYIQIYEVAQRLADGHFVVAKAIHDTMLDLFRLQLEIYRTDIEAFKEKIQIELTKLEVYRSQLEGQRLIGTLNQQLVDIYNAELQGLLAGVEVFKAEVEGAEAQVRAEASKIEVFKARIDAYAATIEGERIKVDIYDSRVKAEESIARVYAAQVDAYGSRIGAYSAEVQAGATKVQANISVAEAEARLYSEEVSAWQAGIQADTANLQAFAEVYRANLQRYTAELSAEEYRVTGEARNFELEVQKERARVDADLKAVDQAIEQMKHVTSLGLGATEIAAKVNSQLAASAMSAINVSAGVQGSDSTSSSDSRSCSTTYSGLVGG